MTDTSGRLVSYFSNIVLYYLTDVLVGCFKFDNDTLLHIKMFYFTSAHTEMIEIFIIFVQSVSRKENENLFAETICLSAGFNMPFTVEMLIEQNFIGYGDIARFAIEISRWRPIDRNIPFLRIGLGVVFRIQTLQKRILTVGDVGRCA